jgi:hypothetical protein
MRWLAEQLRPLVVVWLLLTLPVVCHNETAVMFVGAITGGNMPQHSLAQAAGPATQHSGHGAAARPSDPVVDGPAQVPTLARTLLGWSADHGGAGARAVPDGQDGFALADRPSLLTGRSLMIPARWHEPGAADDLSRPPPAPPPRLVA